VDCGETCGLVGVYRDVCRLYLCVQLEWSYGVACAAWAWWRCTVGDAASDGGRGDAGGGLSSSVICAFYISVRGL
jgi:hypothetical protein